MLQTLKRECFHDALVAWSYAIMGAGLLLNLVDFAAAVLGDPDLSAQITAMLHASPKAVGVFSMVAGKILFIARARTLIRAAKAAEPS